ncbi:hypothetical protein PR048_033003 [Dryococelus australis]|uniref:Uncharacterized protein n=1 Tax=Dryococelus australis TaxID=614101 RepID=A0ABQ9G3V1_9NEOP|nr:hypothetical protein PR048_033003 [Dryococelus australis]
MSLTMDEHIKIILRAGSGSCTKIADDFNIGHPGRTITHAIAKLIKKFKMAGSVVEWRRSDRPQMATNGTMSTMVLAAMTTKEHPPTINRDWSQPSQLCSHSANESYDTYTRCNSCSNSARMIRIYV